MTVEERIRPYAYYALALLTLANFVNLIDRQILAILTQSVKSDLHLTDAQLGFLLGTALAVFSRLSAPRSAGLRMR